MTGNAAFSSSGDPQAEPIEVEFDCLGVLTFALEQAGVPLVPSVRIRNRSDVKIERSNLRVRLTPELGDWIEVPLSSLEAGEEEQLGPLPVSAPPGHLRKVVEAERAALEWNVEREGARLAGGTLPAEILAFNEWPGVRAPPHLLASFVLPNHPVIAPILVGVRERFLAATGSGDLDGYQRGDPARVLAMVEALYATLQSYELSYVGVPASFVEGGQKIRLPDAVLRDRMGCCLDVTVLAAACLEQMGLNPVLILVRGHAFPAVWLEDDRFGEGIVEDAARLRNRMELGHLVAFDSSATVSMPRVSFSDAFTVAKRHLADDEKFKAAIDVGAVRREFRPLPLRLESGVDAPIVAGAASAEPAQGAELERLRVLAAAAAAEREAPSEQDEAEAPPEDAATRFQRWKERLLDLSMRNRLLNFRPGAKGAVPLDTPDLARFEDLLAGEGDFEIQGTTRLADDPRDHEFVRARRADDAAREALRRDLERKILHAPIAQPELEARALHLVRTARTDLEEGGANTLHLAVGLLRWFEEPGGPERLAPLLLYPVTMAYDRLRRQVRLRRLAEEPFPNVTLIEKLRLEYGVELHTLANLEPDESGVDVERMIRGVREAIARQSGWEVQDRAAIGLFSFTKFLMWKDLKENEGRFLENPVVRHIADRIPVLVDQPDVVDPNDIDREIPPDRLPTVLDADSTQLSAVASVLRGRSFVVQGPPGTGKSQTIANVIAAAMGEGKTVLFVSEKMAALEVVHRRLEAVGLGDFCLELHSHKSQKKDVIASICRALDRAERSDPGAWAARCAELAEMRARLDEHVGALHRKHPLGRTFFEASARLLELEAVEDANISIEGVETLDESALRQATQAIEDLAAASSAVEPMESNPFRLSDLDEWTGAAESALASASAEGERAFEVAIRADAALAGAMEMPPPRTPKESLARAELAAAAADGMVAAAVGERWPSIAAEGGRWVADARAAREKRAALETRWRGELFERDLATLHARFVRWAGAFVLLRWLMLFGARRELTKVSRAKLGDASFVRADLASALELREAEADLGKRAPSLEASLEGWAAADGADALEATLRRGERIHLALDALPSGQAHLDGLGRSNRKTLRTLSTQATEARAASTEIASRLSELLRLSGAPGDETDGADEAWLSLCRGWRQDLRQLRAYCRYRKAGAAVASAGWQPWFAAHREGRLLARDLPAAFEKNFLARWTSAIRDGDPALRTFDGAAHHRLVERFAVLDREHLDLSRAWIVSRLEGRLPGVGARPLANSEPGLLRREQQKRARHLPVRKLLQAIPTLLPRLKPCLLMSPLSVAQYLPADAPPFDLLVFDEASQIGTHDAIGALARGRQVVVVGDSKQLPPTSFFQKAARDDEALDENDVVELESVLDEAVAKGLPQQILGWHYRSRHEALIDFSNRHYYEGRLNVFPAAAQRTEGLGISWHHVPDGVYLGGKEARTNPREAEALVEHLVAALRRHPAGSRTFGVVTFSMAQRSLVEDLLDEARVRHPEIDAHFDGPEGVFVKNLENVQGDERDEIYFSICYAEDEAGRMRMHFGPLSNSGGERRLNVAITRARRKLNVFSSITFDRIDTSRTAALGARHLRAFLEFAARHGDSTGRAQPPTKAFATAFEASVHDALVARGHEVHTAVGCGNYRVDLAIADPSAGGTYVLGVELDGRSYASGATARDRDRLRGEVLRSLGWRMHRIWSEDWWFDREHEMARLEEALDAAKRVAETPVSSPPVASPPAVPPIPAAPATRAPETVRHASAPVSIRPESRPFSGGGLQPYRTTLLPRVTADLFAADGVVPARRSLEHVVGSEGPIHVNALMRRVLEPFGLVRLTARPRERLGLLIRELARRGAIVIRGDFAWPPSLPPETYSACRGTDEAGAWRPVDEIAPEEIANGIALVLKDCLSIPREDLLRETARSFGVQRLGANVASSVEQGLAVLVAAGRCAVEGDRVVLRR